MRSLLKFLAGGWPRNDHGQPLRLDISAFDTIYAVGDVHGCLDEVKLLERKVFEDAARHGRAAALLYLGDVVDRGPKAAHVLDHMTAAGGHLPRLCLRGNHEQFFIDFIANPKRNLDWLSFGGQQTLNSYGIYEDRKYFEAAGQSEASALLCASIPERHVTFLQALPHYAEAATTLFCHAGIDPSRPIEGQRADDFMWSREAFLAHTGGYPKLVIHGHTRTREARHEFGRVGLDTGAYETGLLSCAKVELPAGAVSFLTSK